MTLHVVCFLAILVGVIITQQGLQNFNVYGLKYAFSQVPKSTESTDAFVFQYRSTDYPNFPVLTGRYN